MILNALGIDPQKQFKGPWRYYSQEVRLPDYAFFVLASDISPSFADA